MEDVLAVYMRPHNPERPLVCLDETSKQLVAETRTPILMKPGSPARHDYEYERHGVANLFMMFELTPDLGPLAKCQMSCSVATDGARNDEVTQEV